MEIFLVVLVCLLILLFFAKGKIENNENEHVILSSTQENNFRDIAQQETALMRKISARFEDITLKIFEGEISYPPDIYTDYRYHAFDRAMKRQGFLVSDAVLMLNDDMQFGAEEKMRQALFFFIKKMKKIFLF